MFYYQIVNREGKPFGSSIETGEQLLKLVTPKLQTIMKKLQMKVVLTETPRRLVDSASTIDYFYVD